MPLAPACYDPDRFTYEGEPAGPAYERECAETAARIANDIQLVMSVAEKVARAWAKDDLLDLTEKVSKFDHAAHQWTTRTVPVDTNTAAARLAALIHEAMQDALSKSAVEAQQVAGG